MIPAAWRCAHYGRIGCDVNADSSPGCRTHPDGSSSRDETRLSDLAGVREFWFRTTTLRVIQLSRMGLPHLTGSGHSLAALHAATLSGWGNPLPQSVRFPVLTVLQLGDLASGRDPRQHDFSRSRSVLFAVSHADVVVVAGLAAMMCSKSNALSTAPCRGDCNTARTTGLTKLMSRCGGMLRLIAVVILAVPLPSAVGHRDPDPADVVASAGCDQGVDH